MTNQEIDLILEKHLKWLNADYGVERTNLSEANLSGCVVHVGRPGIGAADQLPHFDSDEQVPF